MVISHNQRPKNLRRIEKWQKTLNKIKLFCVSESTGGVREQQEQFLPFIQRTCYPLPGERLPTEITIYYCWRRFLLAINCLRTQEKSSAAQKSVEIRTCARVRLILRLNLNANVRLCTLVRRCLHDNSNDNNNNNNGAASLVLLCEPLLSLAQLRLQRRCRWCRAHQVCFTICLYMMRNMFGAQRARLSFGAKLLDAFNASISGEQPSAENDDECELAQFFSFH